IFFFFSSRRRHTRSKRDWSSDVCSSDLGEKETIHIEGERLSSSSTYFPFIHATIYSKNGDKWTIDLPGGFNPSFEYIDITNNGRSEERRVGKECRKKW